MNREAGEGAQRGGAALAGLWVEVARGALDGEEGHWVSLHRRAGGPAVAMLWVPQRGPVRGLAPLLQGLVDKR